MKLTAATPQQETVAMRDMKQGDIGVVVSGEFSGEVFLCNIAGWHGLTEHRYWASDYMERQRGNKHGHAYVPDIHLRLLKTGDTLTVIV